MNNNRNFKTIAVAAIIVSVICVSVAFAALSTSLSISGTGTVTSTNAWKMSFTNIKNESSGSGVTVSTSPVASSTPNLTWNAIFKAPKNSYTFTATLTNSGTIPAKLETGTYLNASGDAYTTIAGTDPEEKTFAYTVTIAGQSINDYAGYIWAAGASKDIVVTVTFDANGKLTQEALSALNTELATFTLNLPFSQATDTEVSAATTAGKIFTT